MLSLLKKFIDNFEGIIAGICFSVLVILINYEVVMRYCFLSPGAYTEEICRYLFIYCIFLSMAYTLKEKSHIISDIIPESLPKRFHISLDIFGTLVFLAFAVFMVVTGEWYVEKMYNFERPTEAMGVPLWWFCIAPPIGFAFTSLRAVQSIYSLCRDFKAAN